MFSKNFVWGAATSSYQIEGAAFEDGKGLNIWDVFCKQEGRIFEGNTGGTLHVTIIIIWKKMLNLWLNLGLKPIDFP